jgi:catechol 2,3-dioxygenase-like lactoylglutathione lyase family enzyme
MNKSESLNNISLHFHHVGLVVSDIRKAIKYLSSLGIGPFENPYRDPPLLEKLLYGKPTEYSLELSNGKLGEIYLELIQPIEGKSIWKDFLDKNGEGIHHIGFVVTFPRN